MLRIKVVEFVMEIVPLVAEFRIVTTCCGTPLVSEVIEGLLVPSTFDSVAPFTTSAPADTVALRNG